jgi:renalase
MKVAVIGAGMAGLACAAQLMSKGHVVNVFEKARGPGGRMSTRRVSVGTQELQFDHGAQYFTAREAAFVAQVATWENAEVVARWPVAGVDAWVGTPGMNAPLREMAARCLVNWNTRVLRIDRVGTEWLLSADATRFGVFDTVVIALPAEQATPLLADHDEAAAALARATISLPCWTVMVSFALPLALPDDVLRNGGIIGWAARNSSKPRRKGENEWVIQATHDWSTAHVNDPAYSVQHALLAALRIHAKAELPDIIFISSQRWLYAKSGSANLPLIWNASLKLGVCGDWLRGPRIECAWLSGAALADAIGAAQ